MKIPREMVIERIRATADAEAAERAEAELPEKVDPEADAQQLRDLGLDPAQLEDDIPGTPGVG